VKGQGSTLWYTIELHCWPRDGAGVDCCTDGDAGLSGNVRSSVSFGGGCEGLQGMLDPCRELIKGSASFCLLHDATFTPVCLDVPSRIKCRYHGTRVPSVPNQVFD
jgi:hypothetical protein